MPEIHQANGIVPGTRVDYANCVVMKPWGYEFQIFDNGNCSIWLLYIKPGHGTSVHCHFSKSAMFVPLIGSVGCHSNGGTKVLNFPASAEADKYEFHSVGNAGDGDLYLLEIERPSDKGDLFRLRDGYGRSQGYEGGDSIMRVDLGRFDHFTLNSHRTDARFRDFDFALMKDRLIVTDWHRTLTIDIKGDL